MEKALAIALLLLIGGTLLYVVVMKIFVAALKPLLQKKD